MSVTLDPTGRRRIPHRWAAVIVPCLVAAVLPGPSGSALAQDSGTVLTQGRPVNRVLHGREQSHAYVLELTAGEFVRLEGTAGAGSAYLRLIGPRGDTIRHTYVAIGPLPLLLTHVAEEPGRHRVDVVRFQGDTSDVTYELRVGERLPRDRYQMRLDSLGRDPRVAWLRRNSIRLRSVSPSDENFSDLAPLRRAIGDATVVLIGEESHTSATTIEVVSRLIKFLHREMGFDVIAFESGLYDLARVWRLVQAGEEPVQAFQQGLFGTWSRHEAFRELARYIGQEARGQRPLVVAGLDYQITGSLSREHLVPELRELAERERIGSEGRDLPAGLWDVLNRVVSVYYWRNRDSLPSPASRLEVLSALRWMAERLDERSAAQPVAEARDLRLWAQIVRGLAENAEAQWIQLSGQTALEDRRDRQMARNLVFLAREYFPGRRIMVWGASPHILRNAHRIDGRGTQHFRNPCCGMGQYAWEALGEQAFVIVTTAYGGTFGWRAVTGVPPFSVVSDQHPGFELEELLAAAGFEQAIVPLRNPPPGGEWLRAPVLSRMPWNFWTSLAVWPEHADAVLFLRTIAPRSGPPARP